MTITETHVVGHTATLRGCELTLIHLPPLARGGPTNYLLQLDHANQTYTRTLTGAEMAALARLNPDDGAGDHKPTLTLLADLTLALELLGARWEGLRIYHPTTGRFVPNALITPPSVNELNTLGRLATELLAAVQR